MPCYSPIDAWRSKHLNQNGNRPLVFSENEGFSDMKLELPCGRCIGCRLEYSRQWAIRCMHEAQMHDNNSFITLTYNDEHYPEDHSIHKSVLRNFIKNLRQRVKRDWIKKHPELPDNYPRIRFFGCGEYGEQRSRPHYHAIIFGYDFPDKILFQEEDGIQYYKSELLESVWGKGFVTIGEVTFQSCGYVARYAMKKRTGDDEVIDKNGISNKQHYELVCPETGEIFQLEREFCAMSRQPGIGKTWLKKYKTDLDKDFFTVDGKKNKLPKYYDNLLKAEDEKSMLYRKNRRRRDAESREEDNTYERLKTKEKVKKAQLNQLKRTYEN